VEKVDLHPTFDISTYIGDVAVVTLTANIDPRDATRRGVYPAQLGTPSQIRYGSYIRLSGWGVSNKAGRGGGGVAHAPPVHAQGAGWPQPGHHARRKKKEGWAAKAAKDDDTDDADDADGADDATAWQAAAATRRTVRGRSGGGNRTGVSPRATAAQRAAAGTSTGLSQPMRLLTTQVHVRVMHECATFAERFIGVTNFFTSRYNEALQVCLSLYDGVSACDGDRYVGCGHWGLDVRVGRMGHPRGRQRANWVQRERRHLFLLGPDFGRFLWQPTSPPGLGRRARATGGPLTAGGLHLRALVSLSGWRHVCAGCWCGSGAPFFTKFAPPGVPPTYYVHAIMSVRFRIAVVVGPAARLGW